jgi:hypothetical protein
VLQIDIEKDPFLIRARQRGRLVSKIFSNITFGAEQCFGLTRLVLEAGGQVVNVQQDSGLVLQKHGNHVNQDSHLITDKTYACVNARNGNQGAGRATATVDDVDLSTANVELGTSVGAGGVQRNLPVNV